MPPGRGKRRPHGARLPREFTPAAEETLWRDGTLRFANRYSPRCGRDREMDSPAERWRPGEAGSNHRHQRSVSKKGLGKTRGFILQWCNNSVSSWGLGRQGQQWECRTIGSAHAASSRMCRSTILLERRSAKHPKLDMIHLCLPSPSMGRGHVLSHPIPGTLAR